MMVKTLQLIAEPSRFCLSLISFILNGRNILFLFFLTIKPGLSYKPSMLSVISQCVCTCNPSPPQSNICEQDNARVESLMVLQSLTLKNTLGEMCLLVTNTLAYYYQACMKYYGTWVNCSSTVVEHTAYKPKTQGSNYTMTNKLRYLYTSMNYL